MLDTAKTVREIAVELPQATRVFEKLGIDYCCGGSKSLDEACASANVRVSDVLQSLDQAPASEVRSVEWNQATLAELIHHIVSTHHNYVKSEIPRLDSLLTKVCGVHGNNHPELLGVQKVFNALGAELFMHLTKEEQILFPYVERMERAVTSKARSSPPPFGSVGNPIHMMMMEHDSAGDALREIRRLSTDYTVPADACISYQTLYRALMEFEADLHQHIHLENNILFPRAVEMENRSS